MTLTEGARDDFAAPRPRPPWWMYVLAVSYVGYFCLLLYSDLTRPQPQGYSLDTSTLIFVSVEPGSPAAREGLAAGDRVLSANGIPVRRRLDWDAAEINLRSGSSLILEVEGVEREGAHRTVTLTPRRLDRLTRASATVLGLRATQLVTLGLALFVAMRRPDDRSARVAAWVLATIAVYSIDLPFGITAHWRALPAALGVVLWPAFLGSYAAAAVVFTFAGIFPRPVVRSWRMWALAWAPMAVLLVFRAQFALDAVYRPTRPTSGFDWLPFFYVGSVAYAVAALMTLLVGYRRLTDVNHRRRVRVVVLGTLVGLASISVVAGYWGRSGALAGDSVFDSPWLILGAVLGLACPVSLAYAVLRHRLFDVGFIVRRGLQYALARRVLVSLVPLVAGVLVLDLSVNRERAVADVLESRGWLYLGLAAVALVARARRTRWLDALDRRFFRERYSAQRLLRTVIDDIGQASTLDEAAPQVVAQIEAACHPEGIALLVQQGTDGSFPAVTALPNGTAWTPLPAESQVAALLDWLRKPLQVSGARQAGLLRQLAPVEIDWLRARRVELLVPIRSGGAVRAVIALGPKRSEEPYSAEDEDLLMAVGHSLELLTGGRPPAVAAEGSFTECPHCGACYEAGTDACARDGHALTVHAVPRLLTGRYRIEQRVGRGGMGTVYAAHDTALDRRVAVKLVREDFLGGADARERFRTEARLAAALTHPNVVTVHDVGLTATGRPFLVMELLEGRSLRDELCRVGRLSPASVRHILGGVCAAVDTAHQAQLVHRDLKPENVFLSHVPGAPGRGDVPAGPDVASADVPKVLDFGLAKTLHTQARTLLTEPGRIFGTPQYMAPERLSGGEPSPDWDLWALAVMAAEMIVGRRPFDAADPGGAPRLGGVPEPLRGVLARALSPNPLERPTSAAELFDQLDGALPAADPSGGFS